MPAVSRGKRAWVAPGTARVASCTKSAKTSASTRTTSPAVRLAAKRPASISGCTDSMIARNAAAGGTAGPLPAFFRARGLGVLAGRGMCSGLGLYPVLKTAAA